MEAAGCCCGPEAAANAAPARSGAADIQFDWSAAMAEPLAQSLDTPVVAGASTGLAIERAISSPAVPLYLSYRAFLI